MEITRILTIKPYVKYFYNSTNVHILDVWVLTPVLYIKFRGPNHGMASIVRTHNMKSANIFPPQYPLLITIS